MSTLWPYTHIGGGYRNKPLHLILGRCTKQYQHHDWVQHPCVDREQLKHEEEQNSAHILLNPTTEEYQNPNAEEYLGLCLVAE